MATLYWKIPHLIAGQLSRVNFRTELINTIFRNLLTACAAVKLRVNQSQSAIVIFKLTSNLGCVNAERQKEIFMDTRSILSSGFSIASS